MRCYVGRAAEEYDAIAVDRHRIARSLSDSLADLQLPSSPPDPDSVSSRTHRILAIAGLASTPFIV
ncbi:hypothetical protein TMatcc_003183 [Talaromyces marneffei ATCC 18224]